MYWWIVALVALVASVVNAIVSLWFVCGLMVMAFVVAGLNYFKYRARGE